MKEIQKYSNYSQEFQTESKHKFTNDLIRESSPYLLQHAHNPVNWYAWNDATLKLAKEKDKPLLISIGYAACHWCHVMEKECFEDEAVADFMNENFICIKVDREERPDIDQIYMDAVQIISGSGGWPLNAIALPDGKPVYAVTYLPKEQWLSLLKLLSDVYKKNKERLYQQADYIIQNLNLFEANMFNNSESTSNIEDFREIFDSILGNIDFKYGGIKGSPKFPMPSVFKYLLYEWHFNKNEKALNAVKITLDKMLQGGIYDQVGGGFARYSTDVHWLVPHFEKMLYDNAQLVSLFSDAYRAIQNNIFYKDVVYETLDFVSRELTDRNGGFYSSLDADSDRKEGEYYIWNYNELEEIIGDIDFSLFSKVYNISKEGNFEGKNIFTMNGSMEDIARTLKISYQDIHNKVKEWKNKLLLARSKKTGPRLDNKIITAWNTMMLKGFIDAYIAFGETRFLNSALKNAEYIRNNCIQDNYRLLRIAKSNINGFLDDYAFTIEAFISLYRITFDESYLNDALKLAEYVLTHFTGNDNSMFYYTSDTDLALVARKKEVSDNVIPASNSTFARVLYLLSIYFEKQKYQDRAERMLSIIRENMLSHPLYNTNWAILNFELTYPTYEVAIVGKDADEFRKELSLLFMPDIILFGAKDDNSRLPYMQYKYVEGKTTIYVCSGGVCRQPVYSVSDALELLNGG